MQSSGVTIRSWLGHLVNLLSGLVLLPAIISSCSAVSCISDISKDLHLCMLIETQSGSIKDSYDNEPQLGIGLSFSLSSASFLLCTDRECGKVLGMWFSFIPVTKRYISCQDGMAQINKLVHFILSRHQSSAFTCPSWNTLHPPP